MAKLVIVGAGSLARLAQVYFHRDSAYDVVAFAVHRSYRRETECMGLPLVDLEDLPQLYPPETCEVFVAIGYSEVNRARARVVDAIKARGYRLATYVSSRCSYLSDEPPGENCMIMEDNTVQPFVRIGRNVILWSGNHIGHDSVIGDHCFLTSHVVIAGYTQVEPYCFIGANAVVSGGQPITLGASCLIGAGSIIHKSTAPNGVYVPARARRLRLRSEQTRL